MEPPPAAEPADESPPFALQPAPRPRMAAEPPLPSRQMDVQPEEQALKSVVPEATDADPHACHRIAVFYATDRLPAFKLDEVSLWERYGPVWSAAMVALLLGFGAWWFSRRIILMALALGALLLATGWWYSAHLEEARVERLLENGNRIYGNGRNETGDDYQIELGRCEVTLPPDHRVGKLEAPSILKLEFRELPEKHVVLHSITCLEDEAFYSELRSCVEGSQLRQALVFVHGYNVSFDSAVKRTAQIAFDLKFSGAPVCYSWPSWSGLADYTRDENEAEWTVIHLESFLEQLVARSGAETVHLIAHSMGNRALLQALERLALQRAGQGPMFGQIVLAAPDVDASAFRQRYAPTATAMARQVTLYASSADKALLASTQVHGYTRAGLSGEFLVAVPGLDTIDVSPIDTSLIGHSYYGDNPLLIKDLQALVELGAPASGRQWLQQILQPPVPAWWVFRREIEAPERHD